MRRAKKRRRKNRRTYRNRSRRNRGRDQRKRKKRGKKSRPFNPNSHRGYFTTPLSNERKETMKNLSPFQTIKIPLASVVRSPRVTEKIDETAIRTSKIMSSALLFLKYYLLAKYDDFAHSDHSILPIIPKVDIKLARAALKTVSGGGLGQSAQ